MCCSGIQFPFIGPRSALNRHFRKDFGVELPPSAVVEEAYWTGALDPEQAFKVRMAAGDLSAFVAGLGAAARAKAIEEDISPFPGRAKPAYRKPAWWNAPPLAGPVAVVYRITSRGHTSSDTDYLLLYEPVGDVLYVVWGRS